MIKTRLFKVSEKNIKIINKFLDSSKTGALMRQEFAIDKKEGLFLIITINSE